MLRRITEPIERLALRTDPQRAVAMLDKLPASALESLQRRRFRRTLRLAAKASPFYREEFRRRGIDVRRIDHPSQLGDFFTTGEDLRRNGARDFLAGRADTAFETTGTTSPAPKRVFFSHRELNAMGRISALALQHLGLRRTDTVLSAFDSSFWVSPAVLRSALQYVGCFHVEAGKIPPEEFYDHALAYLPDVIFGEPSWMMRLSQVAEARGGWSVRFLFAGGENISDAVRANIERVWGAPLYLNYGQTEAFGSIGIECSAKEGYHRNDLHFIFELVDVGRDGNGELVYTTLTRDVMPLIRYRSADMTRLIDEPCSCGLFAKRIGKIRARCDEMVVCGMGNVGPWVFDEILRGIPGGGSDWQAVVKHEGRADLIELHVEVNGESDRATIDRLVRDNLRTRFADFWKNYEMRLYQFRVVPRMPGSLRERRKLRRVVDERQMVL